MKTENEIKTALLNEVIEEIKSCKTKYAHELDKRGLDYSIDIIQSFLPKEEPTHQIKEPVIRCNNCHQEIKAETRVRKRSKSICVCRC